MAEAFGSAAPVAPGIAVGVEYREGLLLPLSPGHLSGELLASAADVFVFDLLFQNFDRPSHNPNCAHSSDGLFVYDFDLCFSFIKDIFPDLEPWRLAKYRSQAAAHVFYPELRRQREGLDFGGVGSQVVEFAANKMQAILSEVPGEWGRNAGLVSEHTTRLAEHASSLQLGIHEVLA